MRTFIQVFALVSLVCADPIPATDSTETLSKPETKTTNSILASPEKNAFYASSPRAASYVQMVEKPHYGQHYQPVQALIIAQPAFIPQHLLYNHAQQLMTYFHNRPGAKVQVVYGFQAPRQYQQSQSAHQGYYGSNQNHLHYQPQGNHYGSYVPAATHVPIAPTYPHSPPQPQYQSFPAPSTGHASYDTYFYNQGPQTFEQPPQIATNAIKTAAPIITGLEHFSAEQQAQIKEQLSSHFGGLTQINSNSVQANGNHDHFASLAGSKLQINVPQESGEQIPSNHGTPEANIDYGSMRPGHVQYRHTATGTHYAPLTFRYRIPQYTKG